MVVVFLCYFIRLVLDVGPLIDCPPNATFPNGKPPTLLLYGRMIRLLAHPLPPSPVIKLSLFLSFTVELTDRIGRGKWGGRGDTLYNREKAWSSINHSILSGS
jgi:hypothetical protein